MFWCILMPDYFWAEPVTEFYMIQPKLFMVLNIAMEISFIKPRFINLGNIWIHSGTEMWLWVRSSDIAQYILVTCSLRRFCTEQNIGISSYITIERILYLHKNKTPSITSLILHSAKYYSNDIKSKFNPNIYFKVRIGEF